MYELVIVYIIGLPYPRPAEFIDLLAYQYLVMYAVWKWLHDEKEAREKKDK